MEALSQESKSVITQPKSKIYSVQDYLELELNAEERHEYRDGEIILMTGGTPNHNEIASNLVVIFKLALKRQPFRTFITDQRLWIPDFNRYTYPDVMVVAEPLELQAGRTDTVINPILIAEILSQGTRSYDKDEKFAAYRTIPSFQEYLLIDQYGVEVEHYARTNQHQWIYQEYKNLSDAITLATLGMALHLAELYENIQFE
jgi:Uma2 family endonuclease